MLTKITATNTAMKIQQYTVKLILLYIGFSLNVLDWEQNCIGQWIEKVPVQVGSNLLEV